MDKNSPSSDLDVDFRQLWHSFTAAYGGLRLFSEQLPSVADRLDEQIIEEMAEVMADVFGDPLEQVRAELREFLPSLDDEHLYPDFYNQPDVREAFAAFQDTAFRRRVLKWARENPKKTYRFLSAWMDYMAQPPLSGIVLRQSALINLVSIMEIFVDGVIRTHHEQVDPKRPHKDRPSWKDRWDTLQAINPSLLWQSYRDPLREIIARRNALVHQGGWIIAEGYLKQTEDIVSLRPQDAAEGRFLLVPTIYLEQAFDTVILFAFAFGQSAWRAWQQPRHSQVADRLASNFIYQTLYQKRYSLVERLAEAALKVEPGWKYRPFILVNWAIACREQSKADDLDRVLAHLEKRKKRRWTIDMAIHILRARFDKARELLRSAAEQGKLREVSLYWPLFDPVREETWFKNLFAGYYSKLPPPKKKR